MIRIKNTGIQQAQEMVDILIIEKTHHQQVVTHLHQGAKNKHDTF